MGPSFRNLVYSAALLGATAGCLPSLNPVYTDEDIIFDDATIGLWKKSDGSESWNFAKGDKGSYRLVYTDAKGQQGHFVARLTEIEGERFLDLYPVEVSSDANAFYKFHLVPIHTVYLVRQTKSNLEMASIDYAWLDGFLAEHPAEIQCATFNGRRLITAPTLDVRAFVVKHKKMFTGELSLTRADDGKLSTRGKKYQ